MKLPFLSLVGGLGLCCASSAFATLVFVDITAGTGSSASQSSTLGASYTAANAIDGNTGNFTHTNPPEAGLTNAWLEVNLATDRIVDFVRIYNRGDGCCPGRLRDLSVVIKDAGGGVLTTITGINPGNALSNPTYIDVPIPSTLPNARFLRVERTPIAGQESSHDGAVLSIGELLVAKHVTFAAGTDLTHSALALMNVSQSSTLGGFSAGSAVNGNTGDFSHTVSSDTNPTWTLDLGEVMNLESFDLANRGGACCQGRLRDITVTVKNGSGAVVYTSPLLNPENVLQFVDGTQSPSLTGLFPTGTTGRYVTISRTPDSDWSGFGAVSGNADDASVLSLGEVRIFGSTVVPEPSVALLGLVGGCLLLRRRK